MYRFNSGAFWIQSQLSTGKGSVEPSSGVRHKATSLISQSVLGIVLVLVCKAAVKNPQTGQVRHGYQRCLTLCCYHPPLIPPKKQPRLIFNGGYFNLCHAGTLSPPNSTANWQPPLWAAIKVIGLDSRNHFHWPLGQRFGSGRKAAAEQHAEGCFYHKPLLRSDEINACLWVELSTHALKDILHVSPFINAPNQRACKYHGGPHCDFAHH